MKRQIRRGVFETNSSSVHSLTMCSESEYEKWKNGELVFDIYNEKLVPITDEIKKEMEEDYSDYLTYEMYNGDYCMNYEDFYDSYSTPSGDTVIAFGYYGHD